MDDTIAGRPAEKEKVLKRTRGQWAGGALGLGLALCATPIQAQPAAPATMQRPADPKGASASQPTDRQDYSRAERLLFMTDQIGRVAPPATLRYTFRKSGALEAPFEDAVAIALAREPDGACCQARGEFLSGTRRVSLPDIEHAEANPVLLYFLEHDVRDMQRLTKGSPAYYRKRIRMAIYQDARVDDVSLDWRGRTVRGQRIVLAPYRDDPARSRFEKFARKTYEFYLADAVPGGVHGIRTVMRPADDAAAPMVVEELALEGARLPPIDPALDAAKP